MTLQGAFRWYTVSLTTATGEDPGHASDCGHSQAHNLDVLLRGNAITFHDP